MTDVDFKNPISIIPFIDLTSLNLDDSDSTIIHLCQKAITPFGLVAAICVYPKFIKTASSFLKGKSIKIASVVNFPTGELLLPDAMNEIEGALKDGANEIDMVFPYHAYLRGEENKALEYVLKAKELCKQSVKLKVIIETGELQFPELIKKVTSDVIRAGADFIKTSTGKTKKGATIEAAKIILTGIKEQLNVIQHPIGIKVSGGIRTIAQTQSYMQLACEVMGNSWITPEVFRIGASKLLDEIISS